MVLLTFLFLSVILVSEACPMGFYGWSCNKKCGFCGGNGSCNKYTGFCQNDCLPKYHGLQCQDSCSPNCGGSGKCNRYTGFCDECKTGYAGIFCGNRRWKF
ncbi:scavenger receptor class F member 2-like [Saccostrea echinata]|uniref:scavenger receptor class F member 2-like n=1 Tax=Saccostrea echinata TaxID=191078 RepID=UPI002A82E601|nr:scavenger receptor class F member 2-like [Saccostrea echinata]